MPKTQYPKQISFGSRLTRWPKDEHPQRSVDAIARTRFTLLAENKLRIDYPEDLVEQVRTVDVDHAIFRIDLVYRGTEGLGRETLFPEVPWTRENFFFNRRCDHGRRTTAPGCVVIEYPSLEDVGPSATLILK